MNKNKKLYKFLVYFGVSFALAALLTVIYLYMPKTLESIDNRLRDYMFIIRGEIPQNDNVVIIDIDNKSLKEVGQWPWPRDVVAQLLANLTNAGIGIIGFDIVFAEPDKTSPHRILKKLNIKVEDPENYDEQLAYVIANTPTVLGYQFELQKGKSLSEDAPSIPAIFIERGKTEENDHLLNAYGTILNIPILQENSYSSGFFNNVPDPSGIIRSVPLVIRYDDAIYPSLALEMIRAVSGSKKIYLDYGQVGLEQVRVGDYTIPTDMFGQVLVNFRGKEGTFKYISAVDVLNETFDPKDIDGKIALIGTSAAGLLDLRATPFESIYPGVAVHANLIDNVLQGDFISKPSWRDGANMVHIFVLVFLVIFTIAYLPVLLIPIALASFVALDLYMLYDMLFTQGYVLNILMPLFAIVASAVVLTLINYFFISKDEKIIKEKFASKVSPAVMEDILATGGDVLAGKEKEITVFFSDVRNFTNISEAMGDAKTLIEFMNKIMDPMTEIIIREKGTVDKFIGDAIMAYWNAPGDVPDHADRAVVATLKQQYALKILNKELRENPKFINVVKMSDDAGLPIVDIGIGLNTGVAVVGEMGSTHRSDYTCIGDPINLGARLESLCKYYNSRLNLSNFTKEKLEGKYIFRFLDLVTVKGKKEPIEVWQIHDFDRVSDDDNLYGVTRVQLDHELELYHHAIELYKAAKFEEALKIFKDIESWDNKTNKHIYKIYIERCEHYIEEPPVDFNGVFKHTTKG